MRALAILGAVVALAGCASTSPKNAFDDVAANVERRSGHKVRWDQGTDDDKAAERALDQLLSKELSADAAVQIALLANAGLQAKLEELSIAQADLVQAGLLENPMFTIGKTAWESEHIDPNIFANVEQNFLSLLTMPLRKRVAATELEATKLEVGDHVLELAAQVRAAFYEAQAAEQIVAMRRLVDDASRTSSDIAKRQAEAGNMNDLNLSTTLALSAQTSLDRKRAEGEAAVAREKLNKLMGLWGPRTSWKMPARLPDIPAGDPALERLESTAIEHRLDVAAAQRNIQAMRYALSLAKTTRWVGTVNVQVEAGRLRHNRRFSFGPAVALEIPLFDQRQAQIAKLEAFLRQGEAELRALAIDVRADVRSTRARVVAARAVALEYAKVVVPQRENVVRYSQEQYDAMLLGVYQLIQAKQSEYDAYREYIEAVRDYWIARSDLERAVGTRLGGAK
jgi:cobalt-zinc-cadmium efflux system outer membrane protein